MSYKVLVSTNSQIKLECLKRLFSNCKFDTYSISGGTEQPFGFKDYNPPNIQLYQETDENYQAVRDSLVCCWFRHQKLLENDKIHDYDLAISIESGIYMGYHNPPTYYDVVDVVITEINTTYFKHYTTLNMPIDEMIKIPVPLAEANRLYELYEVGNQDIVETSGSHIATTYQLFEEDGKVYNSKNWMKAFGLDRHIQITKSIDYVFRMLKNNLQKEINNKVILTHDFPEKGILFQDYQNVFGSNRLKHSIGHYFASNLQKGTKYTTKTTYQPDDLEQSSKYVVVGPEFRGYFGTHIAEALECPHIMLRKGKDGKTLKMGGNVLTEYITTKEYKEKDGCAEFFYCRPELIKNKKVIIFDDVLATGGSIDAIYRLITKCGGNVVKMCFLADVPELRQTVKKKLTNYKAEIDIVFDSSVLK